MSDKLRDVLFLDIDLADRIAYAYKKGSMSYAQALHKLINDCNLSEHIAKRALDEGPQYYSDDNPPGDTKVIERIIFETLNDGTLSVTHAARSPGPV